jgi:S1-C subfamily serine protease
MRPATTVACLLLAAAAGRHRDPSADPDRRGPGPGARTGDPGRRARRHAAAAGTASAAAPAPAEIGAPMPSLAPMLQRVTPAVVNITTKQVVRVSNPIAEFFGGGRIPMERIQQSLGSGVIVDATRGLILTNNHVIEGADQVQVTLGDGRTVEAKLSAAMPTPTSP